MRTISEYFKLKLSALSLTNNRSIKCGEESSAPLPLNADSIVKGDVSRKAKNLSILSPKVQDLEISVEMDPLPDNQEGNQRNNVPLIRSKSLALILHEKKLETKRTIAVLKPSE
jgi:hypothetical protein